MTATFRAERPMCGVLTPCDDAGQADRNDGPRGDSDSRLLEARRGTPDGPVGETVGFERQSVLRFVEYAVAVQILERCQSVGAGFQIGEAEPYRTGRGRRALPHSAVPLAKAVCAEADKYPARRRGDAAHDDLNRCCLRQRS